MSPSPTAGILALLAAAASGCSACATRQQQSEAAFASGTTSGGAAHETRQQPAEAAPAPATAEPARSAGDAEPPAAQPWRRGERPLIDAGSLDVPTADGRGEVSLLAFSFDPQLVEAWRFDACVAAAACRERALPQPEGGPESPAVGMRWEDANGYCATRGLRAQSPLHDFAIRVSLGSGAAPSEVLLDANSEEVVTTGFRCVRVSE